MLESFRKNKKGIILILMSSLTACIGQLFWKLSNGSNLIMLLTGFGFYGVGALLMIIAYKYGSLSVLQPMMSFSYILSIFIGTYFFSEVITINKIIGVLAIIFGVTMIGGGDI